MVGCGHPIALERDRGVVVRSLAVSSTDSKDADLFSPKGATVDADGKPNDADGDGIADIADTVNGNGGLGLKDSDGDGTPDITDTDDDGDGLTDVIEGLGGIAHVGARRDGQHMRTHRGHGQDVCG